MTLEQLKDAVRTWSLARLDYAVPAIAPAASVPSPSTPAAILNATSKWLGITEGIHTKADYSLLSADYDLLKTKLDQHLANIDPATGKLFIDKNGPHTHFLLPAFIAAIMGPMRGKYPLSYQDWENAAVNAATCMKNGIPGIAGAEINWWTNANVEMMEAIVYALMFRLATRIEWQQAYDKQVDQIFAPPQTGSFVGMGAVVTQAAAVPTGDWADARLYVTENGGYDPDYSQVQCTLLAKLWKITGDIRVLRMLNGIMNTLISTLNLTTMRFDGVGTRRTYPDGIPLFTPALPTLAWSGARPDLLPLVEPSFEIALKGQFPAAISDLTSNPWWPGAFSSVPGEWLRLTEI